MKYRCPNAVPPASTFSQRGFTLTEMAVVMVIVALLIGGMVMPLSAQQDARMTGETDNTLKNIHEALIGYAIANGRLPCPATFTPVNSNGRESFAGGGNEANGECATYFDGFVPAADLGIRPTDNDGFAIDAWGNRIRYAVSDQTVAGITRAITRTDGIKSASITNVANATLLSVCNSATGITAADCGTAIRLVSNTPAVALSTGKNGSGTSADEVANSTTFDAVFVSRDIASSTLDDRVTWLSPHTLFNRMTAAGRLP